MSPFGVNRACINPLSKAGADRVQGQGARWPNLFIIGAPKCGTTALVHYLRDHPQIYFSPVKEPHHFNTDSPYREAYRDELKYLALFSGAEASKYRAEASVYYLVSKVALSNILNTVVDAKFIAMIRNPLEMAPSFHQQIFFSGKEDQQDFSNAWLLQGERARGRMLPVARKLRDFDHLQYRYICSLGTQLERAMKIIPSSQLHVVVFDDFVTNTRGEYLKVLRFLDVADDLRSDFPRVNAAKTVRSKAIHSLLHFLPKPLYGPLRRAKRAMGLDSVDIGKTLTTWNKGVAKSPNVQEVVHKEMREAFTPEIRKLERLLGRSFSHWLE